MVRSSTLTDWMCVMVAGVGMALAAANPVASTSPQRVPEREAEPASSSDGPEQAGHCPRGARPGEVLWTYRALGGDHFTLAVGDDGTVYVPTISGKLYAVDCRGHLRWKLDASTDLPDGANARFFYGGPLIGDDGRIYLVTGVPSRILAFEPSGSLRWLDAPVTRDEGEISMPALTLDRQGRIFGSVRRFSEYIYPFGDLFAVDRFGGPVAGFPIQITGKLGPALVLADDRLAFIGGVSRPVRLETSTPGQPSTPVATATPARSGLASVLLPLAWSNRKFIATPAPTIDPLTKPIVEPPQLVVLDPRHPGKVAQVPVDTAIGPITAVGELLGTGHVVITQFGRLRPGRIPTEAVSLLAFAVDTDPPRRLWEHALRKRLAARPVLGRHDDETETSELIYLDSDGLLVSLQVPDTSASTAVPRFNWARSLDIGKGTSAGLALGDAGLLYLFHDATVRAFDRKDGAEVWTLRLDPRIDSSRGSLTLGPDGSLYVGTSNGIIAISTESGGLDPEAAWPATLHDSRNTGRAEW